jgi:serine/threonine protein kinase
MEQNYEEVLLDLLMRWEELRDRGQSISVDALCRERPDLRDELRTRIEALEATAWLEKPSDDDDPPDCDEEPPAPGAPRVFSGRYRLDSIIAEGGFAQVWKATDLELKRVVAVKIPKPSRLESSTAFLAEAQRVARLKHDRIVAVHDVGREKDACFIVSEYVEGGSLKSILAKGPLSVQQTLSWMTDIAEALQYAHDNGIIHRDIKPANILIDHHNRATLADFGIAQSPLKAVKSVGTLKYMSPEQLAGDTVDGRADVFSLAVVLHECLTGRLPHAGKGPPIPGKKMAEGVATTLPRGIRTVCKRSLSHEPNSRPASAREFAASLQKAHKGWKTIKWVVLALGLLCLGLTAFAASHLTPLVTASLRQQLPGNDLPDWRQNDQDFGAVVSSLSSAIRPCLPKTDEIASTRTPYVQRGGGVVAPDGTVICMPTESGSILQIDPVRRTAKTIASLKSPSGTYFGGVLAPDGCIYGIPHTATDVLRFDPKTREVTTFGEAPGRGAYWGGVVANNGKIYCIPSWATEVLVIDPVSRQLSRFGELDPGQYKYSGAVLAPNGKIYCMPDRANRILVIDPEDESIQHLNDDLGDRPAKAFGGVLAPNGKIYSGLAGANRIIVIDPASDTVAFIDDLPASKYVGGVLGPDGKIYCIPNHPGSVLVLDPHSHETESLSGTIGDGEYWGAVLTPHGSIIGVPWEANNVLMIDFGVKVPADWALSRLYNKF